MQGADFLCPLIITKGGLLMITYEGLFQFCLVIIGVIALIIRDNRKK